MSPRALVAAVLLLGGCCRVPAYCEPAGHSTTYRRHVDRVDRGSIVTGPGNWIGSEGPAADVRSAAGTEFGIPRARHVVDDHSYDAITP